MLWYFWCRTHLGLYAIFPLLFMRAIHTWRFWLSFFRYSILCRLKSMYHHIWMRVCSDAAIMYLQKKTIRGDNKNEYTSWRLVECVSVCMSVVWADMMLVVTVFPFHQFCIGICYYLFGSSVLSIFSVHFILISKQ